MRRRTSRTPGSNLFFLIVLCTALALGGYAQDETQEAGYRYSHALPASLEKGNRYRVRLSRAVYEGCAAFPLDLVVQDRHGRFWPSRVVVAEDHGEAHSVRAKRDRPAVWNEDEGGVTLRVQVFPEPGSDEVPVHNQVTLYTSGRNFTRRVEVADGFGEPLGTGYLLNFPPPSIATERVIPYHETRTKELVLTIQTLPPAQKERFRIHQVSVAHVEESNARFENVAVNLIKNNRPGSGASKQSLLLHNEQGRIPIDRLVLRAGLKEYRCAVSVFGRNDEAARWTPVGEGTNYRFDGLVVDTVRLSECRYEQLRVDLAGDGADELPLKEISALALERYLAFEARSASAAYVKYGRVGGPPSARMGKLLADTGDLGHLPEVAFASFGGTEPGDAAEATHLTGRSRGSLATVALVPLLGIAGLVWWWRRKHR